MPLKDKQQKLEECQEREETMKCVERLKRNFSSGGGRRTPELTPAEREASRKMNLKALQAGRVTLKGATGEEI
jgi:hypothetical protein